MANYIDIDNEVRTIMHDEKIGKMLNDKKLQKEFKEMQPKEKKISFKGLKTIKIKPKKVITADTKKKEEFLKPDEEVYKYTRYINAVKKEILPRVVNSVSMKNPEFIERIKTCKDYQYAVNSVLDFEITDPYYGLIATLGGLFAEQLYGVPIPEIK